MFSTASNLHIFSGLFLLLLQVRAAPQSAQKENIEFEHISLEQGLSQSQVTSIAQDKLGFMWFGTFDGLNRYDGYRFTIYKHDPSDSSSISNSLITSICAPRHRTQDSALWIGTNEGLNKFDLRTETFTRYLHDPGDSNSLSNNNVNAVYEDSCGRLWIGTANGLNCFDPQTEKFTRYFHDPQNLNSLSHNVVFVICKDRDASKNVFWIGTGYGLDKLVLLPPQRQCESSNGHSPVRITRYLPERDDHNGSPHNRINAIHQDGNGALWIGTEGGGFLRFDPEDEQFANYKLSSQTLDRLSAEKITTIHEDHQRLLWIGTYGDGLYRFDPCQPSGKNFTRYRNDITKAKSIPNNFVLAIYEDRTDNLWIGLSGAGLGKFTRQKQKFKYMKQEITNANSLSHHSILSVYEDGTGIIWIGTGEGLNRLDPSTGEFTHFKHDHANPNSLPHNIVYPVRKAGNEPKDNLWIGTFGGISRLTWDEQNQPHFTNYRHEPGNPNSLIHDHVFWIHLDKENSLWIGTEGGMSRLSRDGQGTAKFIHYQHDSTNSNSLSHNNVRIIYEDSRGVLWIGTVQGLNKFDRDKEEFTRYLRNPSDPNTLSDNAVYVIYEDTLIARNTLWIGTRNGLNRFDVEHETFTRFTEKDGLPNNTIAGILSDRRGNLWISTFHGLAKLVLSPANDVVNSAEGFDPGTATFRSYHPSDGLQSYEFNQRACYKGKDGTLYFGGINGLNFFHPDSVRDNPHVPPVVFTDFQIFNKPIKLGADSLLPQTISTAEQITLSYQHSVFSFEFAALDYTAPERNQYAYKLEGFNDEWIDLGTRRFVTFTNLDAGEYVLRVKGSNNDGVWNEEGATLMIAITPPPWKTWWAYTFYALFILGVLYALRRFEMGKMKLAHELKLQRLEAQKLHEVDQIKSRFFANISHEFRTPLTLILGPLEQLLARDFHGDPMQQYGFMRRSANRLLHLINQLLDLSKLEEGSMPLRARPENIIHLLKVIIASFASLAERNKILLRLDTSALPKSDRGEAEPLIVYLDHDKFEKCMNNLLANAIKFTPAGGEVSVAVAVAGGSDLKGEGRRAKGEERKVGALRHSPIAYRPSHSTFVQITVKDTGLGIPADQLDKVFDRFYQVEENSSSSHAHKRQGTGIGLALTKELIELHRGEIHAESELGKGSAFTVRLPSGKEHLKPEEIVEASDQSSVTSELLSVFGVEPPASSIQDQASSDQPVLLIVEDNLDMRTHIRNLLAQSCRIIEASDGTEGLEKSAEAIPDLIISDVMMPEMDGFEFCRRIKTDERTSHIPVILLTARASERSKLEGLETGADDYLTKPFNAHELRVRIKNLLEQRRKLRERFSREVTLQPRDIAITTADELFLQRVMAIVDKHLSDSDFNVEAFAQEFRMSRVQLHRKIKALTDQSPGDFIRALRLRAAAKLLAQGKHTVTEVAYEAGFNNLSYFAKCFREQFGVLPSEYTADHPKGKMLK
ncbi:response regulator [candidate division KSB1 bacterium]|nr:response regulator [candidate division KSB1 bacterium]